MNFLKGLKLVLITLLILKFCGVASASRHQSIPVGPDVGSDLPSLSIIDYSGEMKTLKDLSGNKGLVMILFRSADWCPFCKKHLIELNQVADQVKAAGFNMVGVSYDSIEILKSFSEVNQLQFDLLSDIDAKTVKQLGILNNDYQEGHRFYGIPYPGVLVISRDGKVKDKYFFIGYKKRITAEMLIKVVKP